MKSDTTSKHFPDKKGKQVTNSSVVDLTGDAEELSQEASKTLRIPPARERLSVGTKPTTKGYHAVFEDLSRQAQGDYSKEKGGMARPTGTIIIPSDPSAKSTQVEPTRAVNKHISSPFGPNLSRKIEAKRTGSNSKAPSSKPYNYDEVNRSNNTASASAKHTRYNKDTPIVPGALQPEKAAALGSLKIKKQVQPPTTEDDSDLEEENTTGTSKAGFQIKGAAAKGKVPKPKPAPKISGAKAKVKADQKGKGKAKPEKEVEVVTIDSDSDDSDSEDPIQNDSADEPEQDLANRTRKKSSSALNHDPINILQLNIVGAASQVADYYSSGGVVKKMVNNIEKKEKITTSMKGKQQPRVSALKTEQDLDDPGLNHDDDFDIPVAKSLPPLSPKSKAKSSNAPPPNASTNNSSKNWDYKKIYDFDIEPPLFTKDDCEATDKPAFLAQAGKYKMFINYGGPGKRATDHVFTIRIADETVLSFRPLDLDGAARAEHQGLYTFTFKPTATSAWEEIRKLTNYIRGNKPVLDLYICIKDDKGAPIWVDDMIGKILACVPVKYAKECKAGAHHMKERYGDVLARLLLQTKTTVRVGSTSKSAIQSTSTLNNRTSSPRAGTSSSKTGDGLIQSKISLEPVRKSPRNVVASPELLPRAPIDNTPPDKVVLVWPFENFEGTGAVSITHADANRLQDAEYLNDTLIEYGLKKISDDLRKRDAQLYARVHVFNSFFYKKLSLRKSGDSSFDAYTTVRKWTNKFKFFEKKFIVVPINEHMHWYLAIIVNPAAILKPSSNSIPRRATRASGGVEGDFPALDAMEAEEAEEQLKEDNIHLLIDADRRANPSQAGAMEVDDDDDDVALLNTTAENSPEPVQMEGVEEETISATSSEGDLEVVARLQPAPSSSKVHLPVKPVAFYASTKPPTKAPSPPLPASRSSPVIIVDSQEAGPSRAILDNDEASINLANAISNGLVDDEKCYIYTFDSLGGTHVAVTKRLKEYLSKEAVDKLKKDPATELWLENVVPKTVKVPPQPNFCDCGLYLLHYVEQFFIDPAGMQTFIASKFTTAEMEQKWDKETVLVKRATVRAEIADQRIKWAAYREPIEKKEAEEKAEKLRKKKAKEAELAGAKLEAEAITLDEDDSVAIVEKEKETDLVETKTKKRKVEETSAEIVVSDDEEEGSSPAKPTSTSKRFNANTRIVHSGYDSDFTTPLDSDHKEVEGEKAVVGKGKGKEISRPDKNTTQAQVSKPIANAPTSSLLNSTLSSLLHSADTTSTGSPTHEFPEPKPQGSSIKVPAKRVDRTPPRTVIPSLPTTEAMELMDMTLDETSASPPKSKKKHKHNSNSTSNTTFIATPTEHPSVKAPSPAPTSSSCIDFATAPSEANGDVAKICDKAEYKTAGRIMNLQGMKTDDSDGEDVIITVPDTSTLLTRGQPSRSSTSTLEFIAPLPSNGASSSKKSKHTNNESNSSKESEVEMIVLE